LLSSTDRLARRHMEDFLRVLERPLLGALREAVGRGEQGASLYWKSGRFSATKWGKLDIPFLVPADGKGRVRAGLLGWRPPTSFFVEASPGHIWIRRRPDARDAVRMLVERGFHPEHLRAYMELTAEVVSSDDLEERIVAWASQGFRAIVESGILELPYAAPPDEAEELPPPE